MTWMQSGLGDDREIWVVDPENLQEIQAAQNGSPWYKPGTTTPIPRNMALANIPGAMGYNDDGTVSGRASQGGVNGKFTANADGSNYQWSPDPTDNSNFVSDVIKPQVKGAFEFAPVAAAVVGAAYGLPAAYTALGGSMAGGATAAGTGLAEGGALTAGQTGANSLQYVAGPSSGAGSITSTVTPAAEGGGITGGAGANYAANTQWGAAPSLGVTGGAGTAAATGLNAGAASSGALVSPTLGNALTTAGATGAGMTLANGINGAQTGANALGGLGALGALAATQLGGALIGANAAKNAGQLQADAANRAADQNLQMFNTLNAQSAPYRQAGYNALGEISRLTPQFEHQFGPEDLKAGLAPNYDFQLEQGLKAVRNAGNMQTGLLSGNTLTGINNWAQDYAGGAYQNAFNNYNTNQTNIFNRLSAIAGLGQTANSQSSTAGTNIAGNVGNAQIAAGQGQAAGQVGVANAVAGGLNNAASWYALPDILKMANAR